MASDVEQAIGRGRDDPQFFAHFFMGETLHDGQAEWIANAEAAMNIAPTSNRWGKTFVQCVRHFHRNFYKLGSEFAWYDRELGRVDMDAYRRTRYETLHSAQGWETCEIVWESAQKYIKYPTMAPFIKAAPRSIPPHIEFHNGAKWRFRTLGANGQGIDGKSFYLITIDEAGWIENLDEIVGQVARLRTADVHGVIDLMGTFKPGVSRAFYGYAKRAAVSTGRRIDFDFAEWLRNRAAEGSLPDEDAVAAG